MKTKTIAAALCILTGKLFCQLNDGKYIYSNSEAELRLTINGWTVAEAVLTYGGKTIRGTGEFRKSNGVEWYEVQADGCSLDFDVPGEKVKISKSGCNEPDKEYIMKKAINGNPVSKSSEQMEAEKKGYVQERLEEWRKNSKIIDAKNKCPNCPLVAAKKFVDAAMKGNVSLAISLINKKGDHIDEARGENNSLLNGDIDLEARAVQAKTNPTGASEKLKQLFAPLSINANPIVFYSYKNENVAYILNFMTAGSKCCVNLKLQKIGGIWKSVSMDDYLRDVKDLQTLDKQMEMKFKDEFDRQNRN